VAEWGLGGVSGLGTKPIFIEKRCIEKAAKGGT
jgi:hypothetical protein